MTNFDRALKVVLPLEGGFVDDPVDSGGRTMMGITQTTYDQFKKDHPTAVTPDWPSDVKGINVNIASVIYESDYWFVGGCDKLAWPLCLVHFDACVNAGVSRARGFLSKSNGRWEAYLERRRAHYEAIIAKKPSQEKFRKGWMNRLTHVEAECRK